MRTSIKRLLLLSSLLAVIGSVSTAAAQTPPIPITADQAFDSVQKQVDPITGRTANVALVDVRTRAEYYWVGTACMVNSVTLRDGAVLVPDYGKVKLVRAGQFLELRLRGRLKQFPVWEVTAVSMSRLALSIPFRLWDETNAKLVDNPEFKSKIEALATESGYDTIILYCRTGGRSTACASGFTTSLFKGVYEIDQPSGAAGFGGFEGSPYGDVYNGYVGFPGRTTMFQDQPSVSWKDSGLPMKTFLNPLQ